MVFQGEKKKEIGGEEAQWPLTAHRILFRWGGLGSGMLPFYTQFFLDHHFVMQNSLPSKNAVLLLTQHNIND